MSDLGYWIRELLDQWSALAPTADRSAALARTLATVANTLGSHEALVSYLVITHCRLVELERETTARATAAEVAVREVDLAVNVAQSDELAAPVQRLADVLLWLYAVRSLADDCVSPVDLDGRSALHAGTRARLQLAIDRVMAARTAVANIASAPRVALDVDTLEADVLMRRHELSDAVEDRAQRLAGEMVAAGFVSHALAGAPRGAVN